MKRFDAHIHTSPASPCASSTVDEIIAAIIKNRLDIITVTDHGTLEGFKELNKKVENLQRDFMISEQILLVPGVEVSWNDPKNDLGADILVFSENISNLKHLKPVMFDFNKIAPETIRKELFLIWAHPFIGGGLGGGDFSPTLLNQIIPHIDAIEGWNGGIARRPLFSSYGSAPMDFNLMAQDMAWDKSLPCTGGSDAHFHGHVGHMVNVLDNDVQNISELFAQLKNKKFKVEERL